MRSITLKGVTYRVREVPDVALALSKHGEDTSEGPFKGAILDEAKVIYLASNLSPREKASTLLHEWLHKVLPYLAEDEVLRIEDELFPVLWRLGYRLEGKKRNGKRVGGAQRGSGPEQGNTRLAQEHGSGGQGRRAGGHGPSD